MTMGRQAKRMRSALGVGLALGMLFAATLALSAQAEASCGNGVVERVLGEICDDGNTTAGDGCTNCIVDSGWYCVTNALGRSECTPSPTKLLSCPAWTPSWSPLNGAPGGTYGRLINSLVQSGLDDGTFPVPNVSAIFPDGIMFAGSNLGGIFSSMWVNVNGNITFSGPNYSYTPDFIPFQSATPFPIIAPWYGDVDLRATGSELWYCEDVNNGRIIVTWNNIGYYAASSDKTNTFQIVLSNPGGYCGGGGGDYGLDIEFRYDKLQWYVGSASGGSGGLCAEPFVDPWLSSGGCFPAVAGVDIGNGNFGVGLPESGYPGVLNVVNLSNVGAPGVWRWRMVDTCGNGVVNPCEQCDDGNSNNSDGCTNLCRQNVCGDGYVNVGVEVCDGTNLGALTSSACADYAPGIYTGGLVRCAGDCSDYDLSACVGSSTICYADEDGDGYTGTQKVIPFGQSCADYNTSGRPWTATSDGDCLDNPALFCSIYSYPGNTEVCDGCDNNCNGLIDDDDPSLPYCPRCGNGFLDDGEDCDDGNNLDGDGCSTFCSIESGYVCIGEPSVCSSCSDGIKNGDETDVDCGGSCAPCSSGSDCLGDTDCLSGICDGGICQDDCLAAFFGPSCLPCSCVSGTCDDGYRGSGACTCDVGWTGASCDACASGYYGPSCTACTCVNGTCDDGLSGSGDCSCATGWAGASCEACASGYFGATCAACTCVNGTCDEGLEGTGACTCDSGWAGASCAACDVGYFGATCAACTCVNGTCDEGLEGTGACTCDSGWAGASCAVCDVGYFGETCAACTCANGTCDEGLEGTGACTCDSGWAGASCAACDVGYFGETCTACTCANGTCDEGLEGTGDCTCDSGWTGASCAACDVGYFGETCAACTCANGTCDEGLEGTGTCLAGTCQEGWEGPNCDQVVVAGPELIIHQPADQAVLGSATPIISGTTEPGAEVAIYVDGVLVGTVVADEEGNFVFAVSEALSDGVHQVSVSATNAAGASTWVELTIVIDTTPPWIVVRDPVNGSHLAAAPEAISGQSEPGVRIELYYEGVLLGSTVADENGAWSIPLTMALGDGEWRFEVRAIDAFGRTGLATSYFTVGAEPGLTITAPANGAVVRTDQPVFTGTGEPGAEVQIYVGEGADAVLVATVIVAEDGTWTWTPGEDERFDDGTTVVWVSSTVDGATQTATVTFVVDANTVGVTITSPADGTLTNDPLLLLRGTAEPGAEVLIYDGDELLGATTADANGQWSYQIEVPLSDGAHDLRAVSGESEATVGVVIDTTPPQLEVRVPSAGAEVPTEGMLIEGTAEPGAIINVWIDGVLVGTTVADENGHWSLVIDTALPEGEATITVIATDAASNNSLVEVQVTVVSEPVLDEDPEVADDPEFTEESDFSEAAETLEFEGEMSGGGGCVGCATSTPKSPWGVLPWLMLALFGLLIVRRSR